MNEKQKTKKVLKKLGITHVGPEINFIGKPRIIINNACGSQIAALYINISGRVSCLGHSQDITEAFLLLKQAVEQNWKWEYAQGGVSLELTAAERRPVKMKPV